VLRGGTLALAVSGVGCALAMMRVKSALDVWWALSSIFSGGMLGLFLLGYFSKKARNPEAVCGTVLGVLVIAWISVFQNVWPQAEKLHTNLSIAFGTTVIFVSGFVLTTVLRKK